MKKLALLVALALAGCSAHNAVMPAPQSVSPFTLGTTWTQYPLTIPVGYDLVAGHDGFLYGYGSVNGSWDSLVKLDSQGNETAIPLQGVVCVTGETITPNPDGNIYAVAALKDGSPAIAQVTPQGTVTEFPLPYQDCTVGIVSGSDGNLWIIHASGIGQMTPQGKYMEFGGGPISTSYSRIQRGADKNLWVEDFDYGVNTLIRVSVQDGSQTVFPCPSDASGLTEGPGDTLYMMGQGQIYQVNMDGSTTTFPLTIAKTGITMIMGTKGRLFWVDRSRLFLYGTATHKIEKRILAPANGMIAVSTDHTHLWLIDGSAYSLTL